MYPEKQKAQDFLGLGLWFGYVRVLHTTSAQDIIGVPRTLTKAISPWALTVIVSGDSCVVH